MYALSAATRSAFSPAFPNVDGSLLIVAGNGGGGLVGAMVGLFVVRYRGHFLRDAQPGDLDGALLALDKMFHITRGSRRHAHPSPGLAGIRLRRGRASKTPARSHAGPGAPAAGWVRAALLRHLPPATPCAGIKTNETRLEYLGLSARRILLNGYVISAGLGGSAARVRRGARTGDARVRILAALGRVRVHRHPRRRRVNVLGAFLGTFVFEVVSCSPPHTWPASGRCSLGVTIILVILGAPAGIVGLLRLPGRTAAQRRRYEAARPGTERTLARLRRRRCSRQHRLHAECKASASRSSAPTVPARPHSSTSARATSGRRRSRVFSTARTSPRSPRQIIRLGIGRSFQLPQLFLEHTVIEQCLMRRLVGRTGKLSSARAPRNQRRWETVDHTLELVGMRAASTKTLVAARGPAQAPRHGDGARAQSQAPDHGRADRGVARPKTSTSLMETIIQRSPNEEVTSDSSSTTSISSPVTHARGGVDIGEDRGKTASPKT